MSDIRLLLASMAMFLAGTGIGAAVAPVQAATPDPLAAQIKRCAALTADSGARLACYDALAGSATVSRTSATVNRAVPQAAAADSGATTARAAPPVGAAVPAGAAAGAEGAVPAGAAAASLPPSPNAAEFGVHNGPLEEKRSPVREKRMLAVVSNVSNRPSGELIVTLDNGQVWVQLEPGRYPLKSGDHVEIDVGALGSYVLWTPSIRRATKVTRIS